MIIFKYGAGGGGGGMCKPGAAETKSIK